MRKRGKGKGKEGKESLKQTSLKLGDIVGGTLAFFFPSASQFQSFMYFVVYYGRRRKAFFTYLFIYLLFF